MNSSNVWKRFVRDGRTLQRRAKRDGYEMLITIQLHPAKKPRKRTAK